MNSKENIIKEEKLISYGYAFKFILPITLSTIVLPIASFLDSFIAINALKGIFYDKNYKIVAAMSNMRSRIINAQEKINIFSAVFNKK